MKNTESIGNITNSIPEIVFVTIQDEETKYWHFSEVTRGLIVTPLCHCNHKYEEDASSCELARLNASDEKERPIHLRDGINLFIWAKVSGLISENVISLSELPLTEQAKWIHLAGVYIKYYIRNKI